MYDFESYFKAKTSKFDRNIREKRECLIASALIARRIKSLPKWLEMIDSGEN